MFVSQSATFLKATLILLTLAVLTHPLPDDEQVPSTFGLITVTHTRAGDNSQFMKYLEKYATMDCPIVTEINIVWNNQESMQELGIFKDKALWKRPVYFYRTPSNSMNWRYKIPKESKSDVFFSIDDDITVDCEELNKGFQVWRENAIGKIGPIISYGPRYFEYTLKQNFQYGKGKTQNFFNIGLVGLAFVCRHFMELYYTDLFQVKEMRDYVVTKNNCDDIGLNWVVQYFYPQLMTKAIDGNILNISPKIAQATSQNHYPYRTKCIQKFSQIFGVNTLRYIPLKDDYPGHERRTSPLRRQIVLAKKRYLQKYVLNKQQLPDKNTQAQEYFKTAIDKQPEPVIASSPKEEATKVSEPAIKSLDTASSTIKIQLQESKRKAESLQLQIKGLNEQMEYLKLSQASKTQSIAQTPEVVILKKNAKDSLELSEELRLTLYWRSYLELGMGILIICLIWKLIDSSKDKNRRNKVIKLESNEMEE